MCVCVFVVPTAPTSLTVDDVNNTAVTLSWMPPNMPNGIITQYELQYRRSSDLINISFINSSALNATVTGLLPSTDYQFRVAASTVVGQGPYTEIPQTTTGKYSGAYMYMHMIIIKKPIIWYETKHACMLIM